MNQKTRTSARASTPDERVPDQAIPVRSALAASLDRFQRRQRMLRWQITGLHAFLGLGLLALGAETLRLWDDAFPGPLRTVVTHSAANGGVVGGFFTVGAILILSVGMGAGIVNRSMATAVHGTAAAALLYFASPILEMIEPSGPVREAPGLPVRSNPLAGLQALLTGSPAKAYSARYVEAQKLAVAAGAKGTLAASQQAVLRADIQWLARHDPHVPDKLFYQLDQAAYGHPVTSQARAYARSIVRERENGQTQERWLEDGLLGLGCLGLGFEGLLWLRRSNLKTAARKLDSFHAEKVGIGIDQNSVISVYPVCPATHITMYRGVHDANPVE